MEKIINIKGMSCEHCKKAVEETLASLGLDVQVKLIEGKAIIKGDDIDDKKVIDAITEEGYEVTSIE